MTTRYDSINDLPEYLRKQAEAKLNAQNKRGNETISPAPQLTPQSLKTPKYHNKPTERLLPNEVVIKFGSKKEAAYYDKLKLMEQAGLVRNIRLQVQYNLKPAYTDGITGERFRAVDYLADFVFEKNEDGVWREHIVDTKGKKTDVYIIKRKLMREQGYIVEEE